MGMTIKGVHSNVWQLMAERGIIRPETNIDVVTPAGRFKQLTGKELWEPRLLMGPACVRAASADGGEVYFTAGLPPRVANGSLFSSPVQLRVGEKADYPTTLIEVGKAVLNGVCAVGFQDPSVLDRIQWGEIKVYVQSDEFIPCPLKNEAKHMLKDILGRGFRVIEEGVEILEVDGLPSGIVAEAALTLYAGWNDIKGNPVLMDRFGTNTVLLPFQRTNRYLVKHVEPRYPDGRLAETVDFGDETIEAGKNQAELAFERFMQAVASQGLTPKRILAVTGYVRSKPGFGRQTEVLAPLSELIAKRFPRVSAPAWTAVGMTPAQRQQTGRPSIVLDVMFET